MDAMMKYLTKGRAVWPICGTFDKMQSHTAAPVFLKRNTNLELVEDITISLDDKFDGHHKISWFYKPKFYKQVSTYNSPSDTSNGDTIDLYWLGFIYDTRHVLDPTSIQKLISTNIQKLISTKYAIINQLTNSIDYDGDPLDSTI